MKRFLNISVVLLVFGLLISSGCESGKGLFGAKEEEPELLQAEKFFLGQWPGTYRYSSNKNGASFRKGARC